jgi:DNA-binding Lrp family transcriptional regulator
MRRIDVPFAQVARDVLNNKKLSLKAKGLYAYLYGKPSEWNFSASRISNEIKESRPTILDILKELEGSGLLKREKKSDGRVEYLLYTTVKEFDSGLELTTVKESHGGIPLPSKSLTHDIEISLDRDKKKEREELSPDKPENHLSYLKNIPPWDIQEFIQDYKVTEEGLKAKASDLLDWCEANGKRKKNYKAFLRVAVKKDFGKRTPQDKILEERIQRTRESMTAGPSPFAKSLVAKMKMS